MTKVAEALRWHMAMNGTTQETVGDLLYSEDRALALVVGNATATVLEATLLAAFYRTSIRDFLD